MQDAKLVAEMFRMELVIDDISDVMKTFCQAVTLTSEIVSVTGVSRHAVEWLRSTVRTGRSFSLTHQTGANLYSASGLMDTSQTG
jgi:hypothetical protein